MAQIFFEKYRTRVSFEETAGRVAGKLMESTRSIKDGIIN